MKIFWIQIYTKIKIVWRDQLKLIMLIKVGLRVRIKNRSRSRSRVIWSRKISKIMIVRTAKIVRIMEVIIRGKIVMDQKIKDCYDYEYHFYEFSLSISISLVKILLFVFL